MELADDALNAETFNPETVEAAFAFVLPSYQMMLSRYEAADGRLNSLLGTIATLTLAAPLIAKSINPEINFVSWWFLLAMAAFLVSLVVGIRARVSGFITLPSPRLLYERHLSDPLPEFRRRQIQLAGKHFHKNADAIRGKGNVAIALTVLLGCEIALLVAWIARSTPWPSY